MTYFITKTSFTSKWEAFWLFYHSTWVIKEYGTGDVRVYSKCNLLWLFPIIDECASSAFSDVESACAWCDKQIADMRVKSTTYVLEDKE